MPQVDLETLVSACAGGGVNDRKIACVTLADAGAGAGIKPENDDFSDDDDEIEPPPDFPPESFWLSKDAEYDWFDRNAFLERKDSTKGVNSHSSTNLNPNVMNNNTSSSQRFPLNLKSKASIIGLPKIQIKAGFVDSKRRMCRPANIRLFPAKRSESALKTVAAVTEPSSPKVSCMGRVRSKRGRRRSCEVATDCEKTIERSRTSGDKRKTGFILRLLSIFMCDRSHMKSIEPKMEKKCNSREVESVSSRMSNITTGAKVQEVPASAEPAASEPSGLGGMMRFASGRRSASWGADDFNVVVAEALVSDHKAGPNGRS